jgi:DNA primase large subunit
MQTLSVTEDKLRTIIREEISGLIKKEFMKLRLTLIPEISAEEQEEIEELYGEPTFDTDDTIG